jgi:hypothetical protein
MMRFSRIGSLLVAFLLLTSTAMAYADCAGKASGRIERLRTSSRGPSSQPGPGRAGCQLALASAVTDRAQRWRSLPAPPTGSADASREVTVQGDQVSVVHQAGSTNNTYVCFRDTIDPRGPKGAR